MALMVAGNWDIVERLETVVRKALWFIFVSGNLNALVDSSHDLRTTATKFPPALSSPEFLPSYIISYIISLTLPNHSAPP